MLGTSHYSAVGEVEAQTCHRSREMCGNVRSRKNILPSLKLLNILKIVNVLHVKMNGVRLAHNTVLLIFTSNICHCLLHHSKPSYYRHNYQTTF